MVTDLNALDQKAKKKKFAAAEQKIPEDRKDSGNAVLLLDEP